jgi:hypothetical protein
MRYLTINIERLKDAKGEGYCATIPELNNSIICADTIPEIFELVPEAIKEAKKYKFGTFEEDATAVRSVGVKGRKLAKV